MKVQFQRKNFGDDVLIEVEDISEESVRAVLDYLPAEERLKVFGNRKVARLDPEIVEEGGD